MEVDDIGEKVLVLGTEGPLNVASLLRVRKSYKLGGVLVW